MRLLVCGAAGFIGSTFVELRVREHDDEVTVLDALTYASAPESSSARATVSGSSIWPRTNRI